MTAALLIASRRPEAVFTFLAGLGCGLAGGTLTDWGRDSHAFTWLSDRGGGG